MTKEVRKPDIGHSMFRKHTWRELKGAGYKYYGSHRTEKEAKEQAIMLRRKGHLIRTTKVGNRWYVLRKTRKYKPVTRRRT